VDLSDTDGLVTLLCGIALVVGIVGVVVPILPGLALCWAGVLLWALFSDAGPGRWVVFGVATAIALAGTVVKYLVPGRSLKRSGVPNRSLVLGGLLGIVGFFVIPVLGLVIGFVLGIWLAETVRLGDARQAWPSTKRALLAAGLAMLIELAAGLGVAVTWLVGLATV
jgi:uncharacterized protein YqgC (DUF456 family)